MNLNIKTSVTNVKYFECPRRIPLSLFSEKQGFKKKFPFKAPLFKGNLLHNLLQDTFLRNFGIIEYFYYRLKKDVKSSIFLAFNYLLPKQLGWFGNESELEEFIEEIEGGYREAEKKLWFLAELATSLIYENEKNIYSKVIKDEFQVFSKLNHSTYLTGHIDLIAIESDVFRVIELKTGKEYEEDINQLKIYGEILHATYPEKSFKLELWYSNDGTKQDVNIIKNQFINKINTKIALTVKIQSEGDLPPKIDNYNRFKCTFCELCEPENLGKIFKNSKEHYDPNQTSLDDFF